MTQILEAPEAVTPTKVDLTEVALEVEGVRPFKWTVHQFEKLGDAGVLQDRGKRVHLIEGELYEVVINSRHILSVALCVRALERAFGFEYFARSEAPLFLGLHSDPEPDVAVVPGEMRSWANRQPTTALLVVEVADTTLSTDLIRKASLYARAQIADYWIVNLNASQLHVLRDPVEDASAPFGWRYANEQTYSRGQSVSPLAKPDAPVRVDDLLP